MLRNAAFRLERALFSRRAYKVWLQSWTPSPDATVTADLLRTMRSARSCEPIALTPPRGRILVISPHTDDETIGPGGTLLKARQAGADLSVLYLSTNPPTEVTRTEVAEAAKLGGYAVDFLDLPIGNMPLDAAGDLAHKIAEGRPDHLFVPFILDDHDDHRRANELLLRAHATLPLSGRVNIWAYQVYGVVPMNVMIDVTDVADRKADLIRCYKTQAQRRDWAHYALGMNAFNSRFLHAPGARYAEAFFMVPSPEYLALCSRFLSRPELIYRDHYTQRP